MTTTRKGTQLIAEKKSCVPFIWLLMLVACAAVAHGCHAGGHDDADLLIHVLTAEELTPAAASP
jgi:hypothetical protein